MYLGLSQRLVLRAPEHRALTNPRLTEQAHDLMSLTSSERTLESRMEGITRLPTRLSLALATEAALLGYWGTRDSWTDYLDAPLTVHADAALALKAMRDPHRPSQPLFTHALGIRNAGLPYADIFAMMGWEVLQIDYSHHKRQMDHPEMDIEQLAQVSRPLLIDIDICSGKTIREVARYLESQPFGIEVQGAYVGLSSWPGMPNGEGIGADTVDFTHFWHPSETGLVTPNKGVTARQVFRSALPQSITLYGANPRIVDKPVHENAAAERVACYLTTRRNPHEQKTWW